MRRPDAAGGEYIIISRAHRIDRGGALLGAIADHAHFAKPDSVYIQPLRQIGDVGILGPSRQDFIPDDDKGGGPDSFVHCVLPPAATMRCSHIRYCAADRKSTRLNSSH